MEPTKRFVTTFNMTHRADGTVVFDSKEFKDFVLVGREEFLKQILIPTLEEYMLRKHKVKMIGRYIVGMNVYFQVPSDDVYIVLETIAKPSNV